MAQITTSTHLKRWHTIRIGCFTREQDPKDLHHYRFAHSKNRNQPSRHRFQHPHRLWHGYDHALKKRSHSLEQGAAQNPNKQKIKTPKRTTRPTIHEIDPFVVFFHFHYRKDYGCKNGIISRSYYFPSCISCCFGRAFYGGEG